ncbi:MAG: hypothetical protein Q4G63_01930 [Bacteroidia bacterium]|nr:hypothetical protein [Bacteroidia bacterium]
MNIYKYPIITEPKIFESLIVDYMNFRFDTTSFQKLGRNGQKQFGIDILSFEHNCAVQCKVISNLPRTKSEQKKVMKSISKDIIDAYESHIPVNKLIIATTLPRDVNFFGKESPFFYASTKGMLMLEFWSWDDICDGLDTYPILVKKYFRNFLPNLTIALVKVVPKSVYKKTDAPKHEAFGHSFHYKFQNDKKRNQLPIFDISIINNSDETVLLVSIDTYAERTAAMAGRPSVPIGKLKPYRKYKINLSFKYNSEYSPIKTSLELENPIFLYPKAPLRLQLQGDCAITAPSRVRFALNFNNDTVFTEYIYFECVANSMMSIIHSEEMLTKCLVNFKKI